MAGWIEPDVDLIIGGFAPAEWAMIRNIRGKLDDIFAEEQLARVVAEIRDVIRGSGTPLDVDDTLPLGLHDTAKALACWRLLQDNPNLKALQTEHRRKVYDDALAKLEAIRTKDDAPEPPASSSTVTETGNWNSENRLIMRTHPAPPPASQLPNSTNPPSYANPDGPADT